MEKIFFLLFFLLIIVWSLVSKSSASPSLTLISTQKIYDEQTHAAFTDLILFREKWYVVFRDSDLHVGGKNGVVRLLSSPDGLEWKLINTFVEAGVDLRDPKLSITPEGQLMLLMGGTVYSETGEYITSQPRVAFSADGIEWSSLRKILEPHEWLWRITWHEGMAFGVAYRSTNLGSNTNWIATLYSSSNGIDFNKVTTFDILGNPSEATIHFLDAKMIVLIRRGGDFDSNAWIGQSVKPYTSWSWKNSSHYLGGPNFVILPDHSMIASGRIWKKSFFGKEFAKTALCEMSLDHLTPLLELPSQGDTGYPGMIYQNGFLYISYYSSVSESDSAIYFAKIQINSL